MCGRVVNELFVAEVQDDPDVAARAAGGERRELPACGDSPCYEIITDPACTATDAHLAVQARGVEPAAGERVQVECLALR